MSELSSGTVAGFRAFHTLDVSVTAHHAAPQMHLAFDHPNFDTPNPSTLPTVHAHGANLNAIHIQGTLGGAPLRLDATVGTNTQTLFLNAEMFTVLRHATDTNGRVITHIDASASSGEVGVLVSQANMNIVGGSNNDSFNIVAGRLGPNLQLNGGGGSHNEVILHESDFSAQQYAFVNSFKNIQQLAFGAEFVTFDAAQWLAFNHLAFVQNEPNQDIDNHAIIHNLSASQTLQVDQGIVADITLANAAANVQAHVLRDGWLDLWIAAGQEGPTGGTLTLTGEAGGDVDFDNTWGRDLTTGDTTHLAHGKFAVIDASQLQGSLTLWDMAPGNPPGTRGAQK